MDKPYINEMVKHLNILIEKQLAKQLESHHTIFTSAQAQVIAYLLHHQDRQVHQKDLENVMNLSRPTINGIIKRLIAKDAVRLIPDPADRRSKQLVLSTATKEDALAHQANFDRDIETIEKKLTVGMDSKQVAQFKQNLQQCIDNLQK